MEEVVQIGTVYAGNNPDEVLITLELHPDGKLFYMMRNGELLPTPIDLLINLHNKALKIRMNQEIFGSGLDKG